MKKLLIIFSIISLTPLTINMTDDNFNKQENETTQRIDSTTSKITSDNNIEHNNNLISVKQHTNLLTAIKKIKIKINYQQLDQTLGNSEIYQLLTSNQYFAYLEVMSQLGLLNFDNDKAFFSDNMAYNGHNGFIQETKGYGFGYGKLHIAKWRCDQVYNLLTNGSNATSIFSDGLSKTPYGTILGIASGLLTLIENDGNTNDGMIVHFYLITPVGFSHR